MRLVLSLLVMLSTVLVGCGEDDGAFAPTTGAPEVTSTTEEAESSTTDEQGSVPPVCAPLSEVVAANNEATLVMNDVILRITTLASEGEPPDEQEQADLLAGFQAVIAAGTPLMDEMVARYDDALAVALPGLVSDLETLRDASLFLWPLLADSFGEATSLSEALEDFSAAVSTPQATETAQQGGLAAMRLNQFTMPECGFRLSN